MPDWIYACWAVVALLTLAAAYNHRWHHGRDHHPTARLTRASAQRDGMRRTHTGAGSRSGRGRPLTARRGAVGTGA